MVSQVDQINLLRMRDAAGNSLGYVYDTGGALGFHNDATGTNTVSATTVSPGWHALELHLGINGAASTVEVWLDNALITDLTIVGAVDLGTAPVGQFQIGDVQSRQDLRRGVRRRRVRVVTPGPGRGRGSAVSAEWGQRGRVLAVLGRRQLVGLDRRRRRGRLRRVARRRRDRLGRRSDRRAFTDSSVAASTAYTYAVQARDGSNNVSAPSAGVPVTTPAAATPVFADGFESGNLSAWTSSAGLTRREHRRAIGRVRGRGQHHQRQHARPQDLGSDLSPTGTRGSVSSSRARPARSTCCACATRPATRSATST